MGFSIWDSRNICLSWDETQDWFKLFGIESVPVIYDGIFREDDIKSLWQPDTWGTKEGYVIRVADEIPYKDFRFKVGKFVRSKHVQTVKHWMYGKPIEKNKMEE